MGKHFLANRNKTKAFLIIILMIAAYSTARVRAQDKPQLELGISLRGVADGKVEQGEPMRVAVQLRIDSAAEPGSVVLAPASGTWVDALEVQLIDAQGQPTGVKAQAVGRPDNATATLGPKQIAGGLWRFAPVSTQALKPGVYVLRARLAISAVAPGSGGWTREVLSQEIPVEIVAPSDQPERRGQRALSLAQDAILDDRLEEAADVLDALLKEQRDNMRAWTVRAVVSERAGNILGALQSVNEAHRLYEALGLDRPHVELETIRARLMAALAAPDAAKKAAAPLPRWSWPPRALLSQQLDLPPLQAPMGKTGAQTPKPPSEPKPVPAPVAAAPSPKKAAPPASPEAAPPAVARPPSAKKPISPVESVTIILHKDVDEASILADPQGQWASTATASTEYGRDRYSARQATGAPNVATYADNPNAWCPSGASREPEWLEVGFAQPVRATEVRVRQSFNPGTIVKIEIFGSDGSSQVLWQGADPNIYLPRQIAWFVLRFPATSFPVQRVKMTLNLSAVTGWKQFDAVQLVRDAPQSAKCKNE
ncbi:MAG: hypothetical protein AB1649_28830 [Chloroflexota bacterium]